MDQPPTTPEPAAASEPVDAEPVDAEPVDAEPDAAAPVEPGTRPRTRRRVTTPPPDGTDSTPAPEPPRHPRNENDDRMRADKPPHY